MALLPMSSGPPDGPYRGGRTTGSRAAAVVEDRAEEVAVSRVRVHNFSVSLDEFGTGAGPSLDSAFGHAGTKLHQWFFATRTFHVMHGQPGGGTGVDDAFASAWRPGIGAEIMGRGKFGSQRGPWPDLEWKGWWGDNPPFHTPVFVFTHHRRPALEMAGGTTFRFLDATPAGALEQARRAAAGLDVRIGGGPSTIRQFLAADLIDYLYIVVPIVLGRGERLWDGLEALEERFHAKAVSKPQRRHPPQLHPPLGRSIRRHQPRAADCTQNGPFGKCEMITAALRPPVNWAGVCASPQKGLTTRRHVECLHLGTRSGHHVRSRRGRGGPRDPTPAGDSRRAPGASGSPGLPALDRYQPGPSGEILRPRVEAGRPAPTNGYRRPP
jgi:dihydrofolate reductase